MKDQTYSMILQDAAEMLMMCVLYSFYTVNIVHQ